MKTYIVDSFTAQPFKGNSAAHTGNMGLEVLADKVLLTGQEVVVLEGDLTTNIDR